MRAVVMTIMLFAISVAAGQSAPEIDTAKIDAALSRSGNWTSGNYVVKFFRTNLFVTLQGVRLAPGHIKSYATFTGTEDNAEMMGDICAVPQEVTRTVRTLRSAGIQVMGIHDHFLGESPRVVFIHFMSRGNAAVLARGFRSGLAATATPIGPMSSISTKTAPPTWAAEVESALGRQANYSAETGLLSLTVPRADMPPSPMDFWYASSLNFQEAPRGKILLIGDLAVTADELNQALSALVEHQFQIAAVHNHTIQEQPRLFFLHFWKMGTPAELSSGVKTALAQVRTR